MRLSIVGKSELSPEQVEHLNVRLSAAEHKYDQGPSTVWHIYNNLDTLYAFILTASGLPVAIVEASGPPHAVSAGWWIDSQFRGRGYGNELVDLLAIRLKQKGYTGVGDMIVTTFRAEYDEASSKLIRRFRDHF